MLEVLRAQEERKGERDREAYLAYLMATKHPPDPSINFLTSCFREWTCCSLEWYPSRSWKTHPESMARLSP